MDIERLNQGRAVVTGALGGAKVNSSLAALIATWHGRDLDAYSEESLLAIADIDSLLELNAADRTRLAEAIKRNSECMAANVAAVARADSLQSRNDNQAETIASYERQHKAAMAAAQDIVDKLNAAEKAKDAIEAYAREREEDCELARRQRNTEIDRANKAEAALHRLMNNLGGLTLSMLPKGGYGRALAAAYCDIKRDNPPSVRNLAAAAPVTLKAELLGILDSVSEELIESQDALDLIRLFADRLP